MQKGTERGTRSLIHTYCSYHEIEKLTAQNSPLHSCRTASLSRQVLYHHSCIQCIITCILCRVLAKRTESRSSAGTLQWNRGKTEVSLFSLQNMFGNFNSFWLTEIQKQALQETQKTGSSPKSFSTFSTASSPAMLPLLLSFCLS